MEHLNDELLQAAQTHYNQDWLRQYRQRRVLMNEISTAYFLAEIHHESSVGDIRRAIDTINEGWNQVRQTLLAKNEICDWPQDFYLKHLLSQANPNPFKTIFSNG